MDSMKVALVIEFTKDDVIILESRINSSDFVSYR